MLCSHEHRDHNGKEAVTLRQGMNSPFTVRTIDTWHDDQQGTLRGSNLIHILDDGQFTVAHLGDLGCELMQSQIEELEGLDALLIPVGGYYTICRPGPGCCRKAAAEYNGSNALSRRELWL